MNPDLELTAYAAVRNLQAAGLTLTTAESCTGGLIAAAITGVPGASAVFRYGWVTYCNEAKERELGVPAATIEEYGVVSEEVAAAMAEGASRQSGADIAVAVTGNAGPGAAENKPVGLVFIGVSSDNYSAVLENHFEGDRCSIREQAADKALFLALSAAEKL